MAREIKFRQAIFNENGGFERFHFWGFSTSGGFVSPITSHGNTVEQAQDRSQQYTGLKDANDVEIYEGDILKRTYTSEKVVLFDEVKWEFITASDDMGVDAIGFVDFSSTFNTAKVEVVGNIYETPELLK